MSDETLSAAIHAFLGRYSNPTSRKSVKRDLDQAMGWLGAKRPLRNISRMDVARYIGDVITAPDAYQGRPYAVKTQRTKMKVLITFFKWCHKNNFVEDKLSEIINLPREPDTDPRDDAYTPAEVDRLIAYAAGEMPEASRRLRDLALFTFCNDTGARVGSLAQLQRQHIDLKKKMVALYNTKQQRWYAAAFGDYTKSVLIELFHTLPTRPDAYLWHTREPGKLMKRASISQIPGRACDHLGIERHGVHGFRRALGVRMVDHGISIKFIADVLDDSVEVTEKHYSPRHVPAAKEAARDVAYVPPSKRKLRRFEKSDAS